MTATAGEARNPPAAWCPDPTGRFKFRWWDGIKWTEFASSGGTTVSDRLMHAEEWQEAGFTPKDAQEWWFVGFAAKSALLWVRAGWRDPQMAMSFALRSFDPGEAASWHAANVAAPTAVEWAATGFDVVAATGWLAVGLTPAAAKKWRDADWTPASGRRWIDADILEPDAAIQWEEAAFDATAAKLWRKAGCLTPVSVVAWQQAGFDDPANVAEWSGHVAPPATAARWRDAGFAPVETQAWQTHGFDSTEAQGWRQAGIDAPRTHAWQACGFSLAEPDWITSTLRPAHAQAWRAAGFSVRDATSLALGDALGRLSLRGAAGLLIGLGAAPLVSGPALDALNRLASDGSALAGAGDLLASLAATGMHVEGVPALVEAATGTEVAILEPSCVGAAGLAAFDDLAEARIRSPSFLGAVADHINKRDCLYVRARLDPEALSEKELDALNHTAELIRRAVLRTDAPTLDSLADSPQVRHAREVVSVLGGDRSVWRNRASPDLMRIVGRGPFSAEELDVLASDPTTWPIVAADVVALLKTRRPSVEVSSTARPLAEWCAMSVARDSLRRWSWTETNESAGVWLEHATSGLSRAAAFTVKGASTWQLGDDVEARQCFAGALAENPAADAQVNLSVLDLRRNPSEAARRLALACQALSDGSAGVVGVKAINIWEADDADKPPSELTTAARRLAVMPVTLDEHVRILQFLCDYDEKWLAKNQNTAASPHRNTPEHRVRVAKAKGLEEYLAALASAAAAGSGPNWAIRECRRLVTESFGAAEDSDDDGPSMSWARVTLMMLDAGVVQDDEAAIILAEAAVQTILNNLDEGEDDPSDQVLEWLKEAESRLPKLDEPDRSRFRDILALRCDHFVLVRLAYRKTLCVRLAAAHDALVDRIHQRGTGFFVMRSVRRDSAELLAEINVIIGDLDQLRSVANNPDLRNHVDEFGSGARELRAALDVLRGHA